MERYEEQVRALAAGLEEKRAIPAVHAQLPLILDLQRDDYWQDITLPMLEQVRRRRRDLIKFRLLARVGDPYPGLRTRLGASR